MTLEQAVQEGWDAETEVARQYAGHYVYEANSIAGERPDDDWLLEELMDAYDKAFDSALRATLAKRFRGAQKRTTKKRSSRSR